MISNCKLYKINKRQWTTDNPACRQAGFEHFIFYRTLSTAGEEGFLIVRVVGVLLSCIAMHKHTTTACYFTEHPLDAVMRVFTHHHHDIRSDAWRHASGHFIFLRTRTKAENKDSDIGSPTTL